MKSRVFSALFVFTAAVLLLAGGWVGYGRGLRRGEARSAQMVAEAEASSAALRADIERLERRLAALARASVETPHEQGPVARSPEPSPGVASSQTTSIAAPQHVAINPSGPGSVAHLASLVGHQQTDAGWASASEQRIREASQSLKSLGTLESVRCDGHLCRLEVRHGNDRTTAARLGRWIEQAAEPNAQIVTETNARSGGTVAIISRAGESLPSAGSADEPSELANHDNEQGVTQ